jgi:Major Facilitator Superfamily
MLSKGQEWDWLSDPFWRVQTLAFFFAVGVVGLVLWELRQPSPVVNFRPLQERNFSACCLIIFCAYLVLYGASTSLPGLLQSLFGYDALNAGMVMSPAGFFAVFAMPVVGFVLGRGTDARWVIIAGLLIMAAGNYWMSQLNLAANTLAERCKLLAEYARNHRQVGTSLRMRSTSSAGRNISLTSTECTPGGHARGCRPFRPLWCS